ncbi:MAG: HlyD family secretion protein [Gammaproteobacteria bacterium]|nr:MAG: HlyD family secretion protein [Gammaproteobacteria bacterium]
MTPVRKLTLVFLTAGLTLGGYAWWHRDEVSTEDAFVEQDVAFLAPRISGQVLEVRVTDNQTVKAGTLLIRLDPQPQKLAVSKAEAGLGQARSKEQEARHALSQFKATLEADRARLSQALAVAQAALAAEQASLARTRSELALARRDANRFRTLAQRKQVSQQQLDQAETRVASLQAQLTSQDAAVAVQNARVHQAEIDLETLTARALQIPVLEARIEEARGQRQAAEVALAEAQLRLADTEIRAPADGTVTHVDTRPGNQVSPATPVAILVSGTPWIEANFKETQLTRVIPGQPAEIRLDRYPDVHFTGHVDSIQPGTGARFSVLPPENATGNFVKVTQRVPVRLVLDSLPEGLSLAPGLSAHVTVHTGDDRH